MFDPESHIVALRRTNWTIEYQSISEGLDVEILDNLSTDSKYAASITFNTASFLRQYLPNLETAETNEYETYSKYAVQQLLTIEYGLLSARNAIFML